MLSSRVTKYFFNTVLNIPKGVAMVNITI